MGRTTMDSLLFLAALVFVGVFLWLGGMGRIGTGKAPMSAADPEEQAWRTGSGNDGHG